MNIDKLSDYIFNWMLRDIEREIDLSKNNKDAGNVLCALGLMAYTEFMGSLMPSMKNEKNSRKIFNEFFRNIGPNYENLIDVKNINIYKIFRCGLAHEYFVKETCTIAMLNSTKGELEVKGELIDTGTSVYNKPSTKINKPVDCGIVLADNGSFLMVIEKYYEDFKLACEKLVDTLKKDIINYTPSLDYPVISDSGNYLVRK